MKYLDTSAFVKHYRAKEEGSDLINKLIEDAKAGKEQLVSSFIIIGEIISVFDKWTRLKFISKEECDELVKIFLREIKELSDAEILILEHVSTSTITNCIDLITKHHLSLNDSIHLFTALGNKTLIDTFVCSDEVLIKAAKKEGFSIINPEEK